MIISGIESGLMNSLLLKNANGDINDCIIRENDILYQITSSENQKNIEYNNISSILFEDCEDILKDKYNINKNQSLIIFKIDYYKNNSLIPIVDYELFHPINNSKLDLKYCEDELITINIPIDINENNLFIYNPNSEYYLDECNPYTTNNGTDILLKDRQNEYNNNNLSICENNCAFKDYLNDAKKSICICNIKSEQIDTSIFDNQNYLLSINFTINEGPSSSLAALKCYYTLFSKDGITTNIAFYLFLFIFIVMIILIVLFYKYDYNNLIKIIEIILLDKEKNSKTDDHIISNEKVDNDKFSSKNMVNMLKISTPKNRKLSYLTHKGLLSKDDINSINNYSSNQRGNSKIDFKNLNEITYSKKKKIIIDNNKANTNYNDYEYNTFSYKEAIENDKRTYFQYYISLIKTKHPIICSIIKDYNSKVIKIYLFLLSFGILYFINGLFITKSTIHILYEEKGHYNLKYFMPFIIYSFIISHVLISIIKYLCLSQSNILYIKKEENIKKAKEKAIEVKKFLITKYIIFFSLSCSFSLFDGYYLSSFGSVYRNTQMILIKNVIICLCIFIIYPFIINLLPGIFRIYSLKDVRRKFSYNLSKIISVL